MTASTKTDISEVPGLFDDDKSYSPIECCAEFHFARFTGKGSTLAETLYHISFHLAKKIRSFFVNLRELSIPLKVGDLNHMYYAARLLVDSGFWEVVCSKRGKPTEYRPVGHKEWAEKNPGLCVEKLSCPWGKDDPLADLGRELYAYLGARPFSLTS